MKVKKYLASTMKEALDKMKKDLGPEAVILGSRKISRGGLLDFLGKEMVEITATTEENVLSRKARSPGEQKPTGSRLSVTVGDQGPVPERRPEQFPKLVHDKLAASTAGLRISAANKPDAGSVRLLQSELRDIKNVVEEMAEQIRYQRMPSLPPSLKEIYKQLLENELDEGITVELIQQLYGRFSESEYTSPERVEKYLIGGITSLIKVAQPSAVREKGPLVLAFAGTSGVGKTTTLAKLATNKKFFGKNKLALITADTYRVAATQQLGTFSEIAEIPMEIVHSPRDMSRAVAKHKDKEVIMIDTAGGSQFNDRLIAELTRLLEAASPDEVHLVLSITTKPRDLMRTIKLFKLEQKVRLLFTKFDETLTFGSIVSVVRGSGIPLSYLTFGQEVPEDIELADPAKIAKLVVKNIF
ncbi:MAG: flagellar biosynthesis protein FlhF [Candidatus Glassbacteria bacterium]|nr:flagellar biosynthesis protein FlhF [Candidatus Glassbacteria bacterium]